MLIKRYWKENKVIAIQKIYKLDYNTYKIWIGGQSYLFMNKSKVCVA